tara:strand:+ start:418 stop:636 length:219 start_codon:yes stop_codon:yes gene_type:complete
MLTSKLTLMIYVWGLALFVSIFLRIAGIIHPQKFYTNDLFIWVLVFAPSAFLLIYFWLKSFFDSDSKIKLGG